MARVRRDYRLRYWSSEGQQRDKGAFGVARVVRIAKAASVDGSVVFSFRMRSTGRYHTAASTAISTLKCGMPSSIAAETRAGVPMPANHSIQALSALA